ncbi:unnamed protein product [Pedinophyceae sp. YPF-701]|nr:unnamed protein product [Pedinophyceae sp. YPF-701]
MGLIHLDDGVRTFVLLPIFFATLLSGLIRAFLGPVMDGGSKGSTADVKKIREAQLLLRSSTLRRTAGFFPRSSFLSRKFYFAAKDEGVFYGPAEAAPNAMMDMAMDPNKTMGMMQRSLGGFLPSILMFGWVRALFSGFIMAKVPFSLTQKFRAMLQQGIDVPALDVTYVSSFSFYILCYSGMRGLSQLLLQWAVGAGPASRVAEDPMLSGAMTANKAWNQGVEKVDGAKAFQAERAALALVQAEDMLGGAERRAADALRAALKTSRGKRV